MTTNPKAALLIFLFFSMSSELLLQAGLDARSRDGESSHWRLLLESLITRRRQPCICRRQQVVSIPLTD
jgi:hypothetical protein